MPNTPPALIALLPPSILPTTPAQMNQARRLAQEAQSVRQLARLSMPGGVWVTVRLGVVPVVAEEEL